jgi:hypothetical protein
VRELEKLKSFDLTTQKLYRLLPATIQPQHNTTQHKSNPATERRKNNEAQREIRLSGEIPVRAQETDGSDEQEIVKG